MSKRVSVSEFFLNGLGRRAALVIKGFKAEELENLVEILPACSGVYALVVFDLPRQENPAGLYVCVLPQSKLPHLTSNAMLAAETGIGDHYRISASQLTEALSEIGLAIALTEKPMCLVLFRGDQKILLRLFPRKGWRVAEVSGDTDPATVHERRFEPITDRKRNQLLRAAW